MKNFIYLKKMFLLILLVSFGAFSQETEFAFTREKGMTDYIVTKVENKSSAEIYNKIIEWIKVTYKNPDKVILSTIENEYIRFEGISLISNISCKYQIEISIKDGRYKFDIIGLQVYVDANQMGIPVGWSELKAVNFITNSPKETIEPMFKKDGSFKGWCKYTPDFPIYFNGLNKSVNDYILSVVKKSDEGW
ncbi:MAG: hypothetical protein ACOYOR_06500 [Flavobacterium psychrophilum]